MKYERLTYKANGMVYSKSLTEIGTLRRLAELEDKIESGKMIELPCKVGDMVYVPYVHKGVSGIMKLPVDEIQIAKGEIVELPCIREVKGVNYVRYNIYFIRNTAPDIGAIDFYTVKDKKEAEVRLKELQGEV